MKRPQACSFDQGPLPLCLHIIHMIKYLGRHHSCDKWTGPSPSFSILQEINNWTAGRPGNEANTDLGPPFFPSCK